MDERLHNTEVELGKAKEALAGLKAKYVEQEKALINCQESSTNQVHWAFSRGGEQDFFTSSTLPTLVPMWQTSISSGKSTQIESLHAQLTSAEREKMEMKSKLEEALQHEATLQRELSVHKVLPLSFQISQNLAYPVPQEMCSEAQNNYDREVMLHSNSLSVLSKIKACTCCSA